ncbi:MAG: (d)CMP kinase [Cyclobacteriaceae bacterium]
MQDIIIAIDGYSGCGKSSTAKAVAKALDYTYLDSGAMYRAATLYFLKHQVPLHDEKAVEKALEAVNITFGRDEESGNNETYLNGENVEEEIRKMEVSANVSQVSAIPMVRFKMVKQQRALGAARRVVMDGRDIGSHVFPDAELKIFMTADLEVRARRRQYELRDKGNEVSLQEIKENLAKRDQIDSSRDQSPLIRVPDAIEIDTSRLSFQEQVNKALELAKSKIYQ